MGEGESEDKKKCCKRWQTRLFYALLASTYAFLLLLTIITLGTFGRTFAEVSNTRRPGGSANSTVCVLYGKHQSVNSPGLTNNPSCGFVFWGVVTIIVVMLVWMVLHIIMALIGRPKVKSFLRIVDLIVIFGMGFLSLIISSVLTDGLKNTCDAFDETAPQRCADRTIGSVGFYGNLEAAMDTSWTVTIILFGLSIFYFVLILITYCFHKCNKDKAVDDTDKKKDSDKFGVEEVEDEKEMKETSLDQFAKS